MTMDWSARDQDDDGLVGCLQAPLGSRYIVALDQNEAGVVGY